MQDTGDKTNLCHLFKISHNCPIFSPRKIPYLPYFFQNVQWAACHKEINVTCNYKIYAEEN